MASKTDTKLSVLLLPLHSRNIAWSNFMFLNCKAKRKLYREVLLFCFKLTSFQETLPWNYHYYVSAYKRCLAICKSDHSQASQNNVMRDYSVVL